MQVYEEAVAHFTQTTVSAVRDLIAKEEEKVILFLGRPTCPYCRLFAPKLAQAVAETGKAVAYLNSEDKVQLEELTAFRKRYGIATVPALFVAEKGMAKVVCDSSLAVEDIVDFME